MNAQHLACSQEMSLMERAESWPPSEALLLEWIAVTDDRRGERRTAE